MAQKSRTSPLDAAFESAVRRFLNRRGVTGVDVGYKITDGERTGAVVIRLHVAKKKSLRALKTSDRFPKRIGGVPVDVIEAVYEDQNAALRVRVDPTRSGVSLGRQGGGTGTLGLVVTDNRRAGRLGLVTAAHVLFSGGGSVNDLVLQPSGPDGGNATDAIAFVARAYLDSDAALAVYDSGRLGVPATALTHVIFTAPREPQRGDVLDKVGRSTGHTRATVDGIGHYLGVRDSFRLVGLDAHPIVDNGDSGAVWYDSVTGSAIGLHCKGPLAPTATSNYAIAARLTVVVRKLAVTPL